MPFDQLLNPPIGELLVKYSSSSSLGNSLIALLMEVIEFELEKICEKILTYYEKYIDTKVEENCAAFDELNLDAFPFTSYQKKVAERKKTLNDYLFRIKKSIKKKNVLDEEEIISIMQDVTEGGIFEMDLTNLLLKVIKVRIIRSFHHTDIYSSRKDSGITGVKNQEDLFRDYFFLKLFLSQIERIRQNNRVSTKQAGHLAYVLSKQYEVSFEELKQEILEIPPKILKERINLASYEDLALYLNKKGEEV